jgi:hypothetical protein
MAEPQPFNSWAKALDPDMPAEQYDQVRMKYFKEVVTPRLGKEDDPIEAWHYFKTNTERKSTLSSTQRKLMPAAQLLTGIAHGLQQPLAAMSPKDKGAQQSIRGLERIQGKLVKKARREGMSVIPTYAGEMIGSTPAFALATETGGASLDVAGVAELGYVSRLLKGGVSFGLFESASAKEGERLTAGVKGFGTGVAFEGALGLAGKLLKRGYSKKQIDKIVTNVLSGEADPPPDIDAVVSTEIKKDVQASRAEGRPQFIKQDPSVKGVRVLLHDVEERAHTVQVRPGEERSALKDILNITRQGGAVDGIMHHPDSQELLQRFMRASADEGADRYEGVKIIKTAEGHAPRIALEEELDGRATQAVSPSEIAVQETKRAIPETHEVRAGIAQLRDEEGYVLSKGAQDQILGNVRKLWDKGIPNARKEVAANQLAGWDLKDLIPEGWKREKPIAIHAEEVSGDDIIARAKELGVSEAELNRLQEIHEKEPARGGTQRFEKGLGDNLQAQSETPRWPDLTPDREAMRIAKEEMPNYLDDLPKFAQRMNEIKTELIRKTETNLAPEGDVQAMERIRIPDSETFELHQTEDGPRRVNISGTPRRYALEVSSESMRGLLPGSKAVTAPPGFLGDILDRMGFPRTEGDLTKPIVVHQPNIERSTAYHEGLHVDKYHIPGAEEIVQAPNNQAAISIANGLSSIKSYGNLALPSRIEEAFVHAATAIRMGDAEALAEIVKMDGTIGDVFEMVNDRAVALLDQAREGVDSATSRVVQRKMQDLVLRTTNERAWELLNETGKSMSDSWYDPEGKGWKLKSETMQEEIHPGFASLTDEVMKRDGGDWAPSASLFAEARGVRGSIAPRGSGPVKDPISMNVPPDTKWQGWTSVSGLIRPMGPWVADLHSRVNGALEKFGKRLPIYDRWKDVDEAFRNGEAWMQQNYDEAANLLHGVENKKQYAYFETLATDPKYHEQMGGQLGLDKNDLTKVAQIDSWMDKFKIDTNINLKNYLRDEFPRLRGSGYDTSRVYGNFTKTRAQMSTFEKLITEGKLDPKAKHIGSFIDTMLREGFSQKFTDKPLKELEKLVEMKAKNGSYVLGNMRYPLVNYTRYMRGVPDVTAQVMNKTVTEFFGFMGNRAKEMNRHLPDYAKLPTEFAYPRAFINKALIWSYAAGLGLRASIPIRDAIQVFSTTMPIIGPVRFGRGLARFAKEGFTFADEQGALLKKRTIGELYGDIFNEIPAGASTDKITKIANKLLAPSRWGHNIGRAIGFYGEYDSALEAVHEYRAGRITIDELKNDHTALWWNDKPAVDRIVGQLHDTGFSDHDIARNIALEMTDLTLWPYRRGAQPTVLRTGAGRVFGQFGMWPLNYVDFLRRGASKFAENPKNALKATALWSLCNYSAVTAMNGMGADVGKWFWFSPAAVEMSPHAQFLIDLAQSPKDSQEGRESRKRVLEYPMDFFPAGIEIRNIGRALDTDEPMFDDDGNLTPSAIRVLGFTPLKEHPDRDFEDEMLYQMGFGHEARRP